MPERNVDLNPFHTHFILADDGSNFEFNREVKFREALEDKLRRYQKPNQIPMITIVVEGGAVALSKVANSTEKGIYVILIKVKFKFSINSLK